MNLVSSEDGFHKQERDAYLLLARLQGAQRRAEGLLGMVSSNGNSQQREEEGGQKSFLVNGCPQGRILSEAELNGVLIT